MQTRTFHFDSGYQFTAAFPVHWARVIYDKLPIFQTTSFEEFFYRNWNYIVREDRWEHVVYDDNGSIKASMVFCEDDDVHVGRCMLVMFGFNPEGSRLSSGYREVFRIAKELGIKWVCYHKQITDTEHKVIYKEVK